MKNLTRTFQALIKIFKSSLLIASLILSSASAAEGINCSTLPKLSNTQPPVNLHHIFCGELNRRGRAVGYHSNPDAHPPSTYRSHTERSPQNHAGIYIWEKIHLVMNSKSVTKRMSTMFPDHCSESQVINSIVYSAKHITQNCSVRWAQCGPSAPSITASGNLDNYCIGKDGHMFIIATAKKGAKINTAFPVYARH